MGTRLVPSYACLFMADLEERLLDSYHLKPRLWMRYIDDIFFVWEHGEEQLQEWFGHLNGCHPTIKFTNEYSKNMISFLDTMVIKDAHGDLYTDLYSKPTDSHSFLRFDSAHPPMCKQSLPYSQFLRLRRICQQDTDFERSIKEKLLQFSRRGYPNKVLEKALVKCSLKPREGLLAPKEANIQYKESDPIFMTSTFHPQENSLQVITKENWEFLGGSKSTKSMFRRNIKHGYRRPKNLRDYLVRARCDWNPFEQVDKTRQPSANICKRKDCPYCPIIDRTGRIEKYGTKLGFETKTNVCCNSSNLIYCLECKKCKIRYVGQTYKPVKGRLYRHRYETLKGHLTTDVQYHFGLPGHDVKTDIKVYILDFVYEHPTSKRAKSLRLKIEFNWIHRLGTVAPRGLNTMDSVYG